MSEGLQVKCVCPPMRLSADCESCRDEITRFRSDPFQFIELRLGESIQILDEAVTQAMFPEYFPPAPGERRYSYLELLSAAVPVDSDDGRTYEERLNDLPSVRARYE